MVTVARRRFHGWIENHGRRVAAVLSRRLDPEQAKKAAREVPSPDCIPNLDPSLRELLKPVVRLLEDHDFNVTWDRLASDPTNELACIGRFDSVAALDNRVRQLFDADECARVLVQRAAVWRRLICLLAVLPRLGPVETRATICAHDEHVVTRLPANPTKPSELHDAIRALFGEELAGELLQHCSDEITAPAPERERLLGIAQQYDLPIQRIAEVEHALTAPRRHQARALKKRTEKLAKDQVAPHAPPGLAPEPAQPRPANQGPKQVVAIKVDPGRDRRRCEIGDEAEQWALAAVLDPLLRADAPQREEAITPWRHCSSVSKANRWDGRLVLPPRLARDIDEEDLIDALTGLLHVSRYSDAFGFDLLGWLPPADGAAPHALCIEVKGSLEGKFILSSGEWSRAKQFHREGNGTSYAVLVVRRGGAAGVPSHLDLLADPYALLRGRRLKANVEGYRIEYRSNRGS